MRVRALDSFCIGGGVDVRAGTVFDVEVSKAREWVENGHVEAVVEEVEDVERDAEHPEAGTDRLAGDEVKPKNRDPRGARGR